jgi:predicted DNA-binding transcriptional regulator AlpA
MPAGSDWYSVYCETRAPAGTSAPAAENAADALLDLLTVNSGTVSASRISWGARISVLAYDAREAADVGVALIQRMAVKAGMPSWPSVRAEATRQDVLEEDNARPTLPEIVSAPEAAEILGVSPQRVHELASSPGFPQPMYELRTGRLWLESAISAYAERRQRKPGRPGKSAAAS